LSFYFWHQSEEESTVVAKEVELSLWKLWAEVLMKMKDEDIHEYRYEKQLGIYRI
jgi:hypothetical protein